MGESASQPRQFCDTWTHSDYSGTTKDVCVCGGADRAEMILCHIKITQVRNPKV